MKNVTADDGPPRRSSDGTSAPERQDRGISGHIHEQEQGQMLEPPTIVVSQKSRPKKRPLAQETDDGDLLDASAELDDDFPSASEFSQMTRSERKRHREKKRRNQVNAGFDDLKDLLLQIDPETNDRGDELNRVDLIGRAVMVMRKLINDNEALRRQRKEQERKECQVNKGDDLVTIAVPYLVPKDHHYIPSAPQPLHHSTSHHAPPPPPQHHHHLHPDDQPQPYHHHQHHHRYQYPPAQQGPTHASSTASSSAQHQSHPVPHHFPYHHEGPTGHHQYYGDGYS